MKPFNRPKTIRQEDSTLCFSLNLFGMIGTLSKQQKLRNTEVFRPETRSTILPLLEFFFLERTFTFLFFLVNNNKHKYELNRCVLLRNVFFFLLRTIRTFSITYFCVYVHNPLRTLCMTYCAIRTFAYALLSNPVKITFV